MFNPHKEPFLSMDSGTQKYFLSDLGRLPGNPRNTWPTADFGKKVLLNEDKFVKKSPLMREANFSNCFCRQFSVLVVALTIPLLSTNYLSQKCPFSDLGRLYGIPCDTWPAAFFGKKVLL